MTKSNNKKIIINYLALIGIACLPVKVIAQDELFAPFAHASISLDDNVYLLSDQELENNPIDGQSDAQDTITELGAGFRTDVSSSNQRYFFSVNAFRRDYADFSQLNFTGGRVNAKWDWYLNRKWDGEISYLFNREQSNLGNQRLVNGDVFDLNQARLSIIRHTSENNEIYLSGIFSRKEYQQRRNLDNEQTDIALGYKYISPKKNSIAFEVTNSQGDSLNLQDTLLINSNLTSFDQDSANLLIDWDLNSGDQLTINTGYVSRDYQDELSQFNYDGAIFDLSYLWKVGTRTQINWGLGRNLNNTQNTQTLFTIEDYAFINSKWDATQKIQLNLNLRYRDVDFTQTNNDRDDQINLFEFKSIYRWSSNIDLILSVKKQSRDSINFQNEFDNLVSMFSVSYNIK